MNLNPYKVRYTGVEIGMYKNVPIAELDKVSSFFRGHGVKIRIRYRGPRTNPLDIRPRHQRMQDCLKRFANRFTVYLA